MIENILKMLMDNTINQRIDSVSYIKYKNELKKYVDCYCGENVQICINDKIVSFRNVCLGSTQAVSLLELHELCLFVIYARNQKKYPKFFDFGANIGIHSLVAGAYGYEVYAYEPDPLTYNELHKNTKSHDEITVFNLAVTNKGGNPQKFTRVKNNLCASGLSFNGKKYYGPTTEINVNTVSPSQLNLSNSIIKIDIEGSEAEVIQSIIESNFTNYKIYCEVGTFKSAEKIFNICSKSDKLLFSQKVNWKQVTDSSHMPHKWSDGSIEIVSKYES